MGQKCFSTSDSFSDRTEVCVCIFTSCLVFESLKGSVKGSIWSAGKTISIGRPHGSGFAEKNASFTIYGINKPNLLTHKLGKFMRYQIDRNMQISFASNGTEKPFFQKKTNKFTLGKYGCTKANEFSEKIQTAFDLPFIFGRLYCNFFYTMVAYMQGGTRAR